jgi:hypothetical protein
MFAAKDRVLYDRAVSLHAGTFATATRINLRGHSQKGSFVFNRVRTLLSAPYFQSLPHSLKHGQNISPVFPAPSAFFPCSFASVQVSTPLFSSACALFCKNTGGRGTLHFCSFNSLHFSGLQIAPCALSEESHVNVATRAFICDNRTRANRTDRNSRFQVVK